MIADLHLSTSGRKALLHLFHALRHSRLLCLASCFPFLCTFLFCCFHASTVARLSTTSKSRVLINTTCPSHQSSLLQESHQVHVLRFTQVHFLSSKVKVTGRQEYLEMYLLLARAIHHTPNCARKYASSPISFATISRTCESSISKNVLRNATCSRQSYG